MTWLYFYLIDGFPAIAISYRPIDALHMRKRVYYKLTGSTIVRLCSTADKWYNKQDKDSGMTITTFVLRGGK